MSETLSSKLNVKIRVVPTWPVYVLGLIYPIWLVYLGSTGQLGVEPIKELEHRLGMTALQLLVLTLAVTPLRRFTGIALIKFRRAFGLLTFYFVLLHLLIWLVLDVQILSQVWADIVKRPYVTVGFVAFLLLIPIALTSNDYSIRRLGPMKWKRLHQISYASAILGGLHFMWLSRGFQIEPLAYMLAIVALLAMRIRVRRPQAAKRRA